MKNVVFKSRVWLPNSMWQFLICLRLLCPNQHILIDPVFLDPNNAVASLNWSSKTWVRKMVCFFLPLIKANELGSCVNRGVVSYVTHSSIDFIFGIYLMMNTYLSFCIDIFNVKSWSLSVMEVVCGFNYALQFGLAFIFSYLYVF